MTKKCRNFNVGGGGGWRNGPNLNKILNSTIIERGCRPFGWRLSIIVYYICLFVSNRTIIFFFFFAPCLSLYHKHWPTTAACRSRRNRTRRPTVVQVPDAHQTAVQRREQRRGFNRRIRPSGQETASDPFPMRPQGVVDADRLRRRGSGRTCSCSRCTPTGRVAYRWRCTGTSSRRRWTAWYKWTTAARRPPSCTPYRYRSISRRPTATSSERAAAR